MVHEEWIAPVEILSVFQAFGLFPLTLTGGPVINFLLKSLSLLNTLFILIILYLSFHFAYDIFDTTNTIGLIVDIVQIMAPILTHLVIAVEATRRIGNYRHLWATFERVWDLIQQLDNGSVGDLKKLYWRFGVHLAILFWVPLAVELRILYGIYTNFWVYSRLAAAFAFLGCRLSYLLYSLHVVIINWLLEQLAREAQRISNESRSQLKSLRVEMDAGRLYHRIKVISEALSQVYLATSAVNLCFRWSLLFNLTNNFLSITIAFYWNYRSLYFNNLIFQAESLMVSIPLQIILYYVMFTCENCFKPISRIIYHLNRVLRHSLNYKLHRRLQLLLLQLLNQRFTLTAMDLMDMNYLSLKDMIAAITTYLVIFIQFMPKDGTAVDNSTIIRD